MLIMISANAVEYRSEQRWRLLETLAHCKVYTLRSLREMYSTRVSYLGQHNSSDHLFSYTLLSGG